MTKIMIDVCQPIKVKAHRNLKAFREFVCTMEHNLLFRLGGISWQKMYYLDCTIVQ